MEKRKKKKYKKGTTSDWYSLEKIKDFNLETMLTIGQRSNGKSYSVKKDIVNMIADEDGMFIYMRRERKHITRAKLTTLFDDMKDICIEKLGSLIYYDAEKGFYIKTEECKMKIVGKAVCVQDSLQYKGVIYTDVRIIMFDEFMDYEYFQDETTRYVQLLSTITRDAVVRNYTCRLHLIANTITKYNPYLSLYKFDMSKMKKGTFATVHHQNGVTAVLEYCDTMVDVDGTIPKNRFVGFDNNETVMMIMHGDWETKSCEVKSIDGVGWECKNRKIIPAYITSNKKVYELSLTTDKYPIAFVRELNTQNGKVRKEIRYNICYDRGSTLVNKHGIVPSFKIVNDFIDDGTLELFKVFKRCYECGRIIYSNSLTGTEFMLNFKNII